MDLPDDPTISVGPAKETEVPQRPAELGPHRVAALPLPALGVQRLYVEQAVADRKGQQVAELRLGLGPGPLGSSLKVFCTWSGSALPGQLPPQPRDDPQSSFRRNDVTDAD